MDLSEAAAKVEPKINVMEVIIGLFSKKYIMRTFVIFFFVVLTVPAGFVITNWTPTLLSQRGFGVENALTASTLPKITQQQ
ncbi:MAG: hypothetical protein AB7E31_12850 [Desulfitobacterium sp.]